MLLTKIENMFLSLLMSPLSGEDSSINVSPICVPIHILHSF